MTNSGDDAKEAATWDFLKYITAAQQQSQFAAETGYIATRGDARELDPLKTVLTGDPRFAVAGDQLDLLAGQPTAAGPIIGPLQGGAHGRPPRRSPRSSPAPTSSRRSTPRRNRPTR